MPTTSQPKRLTTRRLVLQENVAAYLFLLPLEISIIARNLCGVTRLAFTSCHECIGCPPNHFRKY